MRPIDADAALKALRKCQTYLYDARDQELKIKLSSAKAAINNLPTIQPEKEQLSCGGTTSDTISRQAAIDAINSWRGRFSEEYNEAIDDCENSIKELPIIQPEPKEGHWIPHETPDGGEQYECSRCGVVWEFNDGTPEDNEAYFCPKCGTKMKGERQK